MYDATEDRPTADELVPAVRDLEEQRDALLDEREGLLERLCPAEDRAADSQPVVVLMELPYGRRWSFLQDVGVLAISPAMDVASTKRLLAQFTAPALTTCPTCAAPVNVASACAMCIE